MRTNVDNFREGSNIPAGIFRGTEVFACDNVIYAIHEGQRMRFEELPGKEKRQFLDEYLMDKEGQRLFRERLGLWGLKVDLKSGLFCKFGSLDGDPDMVDGKITRTCIISVWADGLPRTGKVLWRGSGIKGV